MTLSFNNICIYNLFSLWRIAVSWVNYGSWLYDKSHKWELKGASGLGRPESGLPWFFVKLVKVLGAEVCTWLNNLFPFHNGIFWIPPQLGKNWFYYKIHILSQTGKCTFCWDSLFVSRVSNILEMVANCIFVEFQFSSVQSLSHVRLFATPWTIHPRNSPGKSIGRIHFLLVPASRSHLLSCAQGPLLPPESAIASVWLMLLSSHLPPLLSLLLPSFL